MIFRDFFSYPQLYSSDMKFWFFRGIPGGIRGIAEGVRVSQWGLGESSWTFSEFLKGVLGTLGEYLLEIGGSLEA